MTYVDFIIIVVMLFGLVIGYNGGFFKTAIDIFVLFISMVIAGSLKGVLGNLLSSFIPFINFKGLYSPNIIMYQLIAYFVVLLLVLGIYQGIMRKTKLDDKMSDKSLTASIPSKLGGALLGVSLTIIFLFNILLVVKFPLLNVSGVRDSYFTQRILQRTFLVSTINANFYDSCEDATDIIKKYKKHDSKLIDTLILNNFNERNVISYEMTDSLRKKGSLPKYYDEESERIDKEVEKKKKAKEKNNEITTTTQAN